MASIRLIVKEIRQPPIDTPATEAWHTVIVESDWLWTMLRNDGDYNAPFPYSRFAVVGAEAMPVEDSNA